MLNKEDLIKLLDCLELPKTEYYILSSGSMLFYGLRETAGDLDLCVSHELFAEIREKYNLSDKDKKPTGFYPLSVDVEILPIDKADFSMEYKDGYPVEKLESVLCFKEERNSAKDQEDIKSIKEYLSES